jgi:hypothetical protein
MSKKIHLCLLIYVGIGSILFMNWGLVQEVLAQNSTDFNQLRSNNIDSENGTNQITDKDNGLANVPLIINITKNSNATDTVIDFIINEVNSSVVDISILEGLAKDRIPLLVDALKNTNATSIAAEYVINSTKEGILSSSSSN